MEETNKSEQQKELEQKALKVKQDFEKVKKEAGLEWVRDESLQSIDVFPWSQMSYEELINQYIE